jgi:hypothetical protein
MDSVRSAVDDVDTGSFIRNAQDVAILAEIGESAGRIAVIAVAERPIGVSRRPKPETNLTAPWMRHRRISDFFRLFGHKS